MWRYLLSIVLPVLIVIFSWTRFGPSDEWSHLVGINAIHLIAGLVAVYWMAQARIERRNPHLRFLTFLLVGRPW